MNGPVAVHTRVGWILSGPLDQPVTSVNVTVAAIHALKVDTCPIDGKLDDQLKWFSELESLGRVNHPCMPSSSRESHSMHRDIKWVYRGRRTIHHYNELSHRLLVSLLRWLKQSPELFFKYDLIIKDQLDRGIVEVVKDPSVHDGDLVRYLPHYGVAWQDKATLKLRIVCDASAKSTGPSLNDCVDTRPSFNQSIMDILLRSQLYRIVIGVQITIGGWIDKCEPKFLAAKTCLCCTTWHFHNWNCYVSALLLSKLVIAVQDALVSKLPLDDPMCYCDLKMAYYWIRGCNQEWKQFVKNHVTSIHAVVHLETGNTALELKT